MEKLKLESPDFTQQNIDRIAELFPSAITETKDADGKLKKAINFTTLKQLLSADVVDGDECYEFTWVGKKQSIIEGNKPIRKTLRPAKEESKNWDTTENLYIEGDNLEVLKLLQNSYLNSIKMIYIDPPYNTGNDFVYRDNFAVSREEYEDEMGVYDEDENRLIPNPKSEGRYHSRWCSMMYPRLQLARNLLTDDGVIFISIDDNEVDNLRKICDEVFGESCFIANAIWRSKDNSNNDAKRFSTDHNHTLIYSKNQNWQPALISDESKQKHFRNPDNDPNGAYFDGNPLNSPNYRENLIYNLITPSGNVILPPKNGWRWSKDLMQKKIESGEIRFNKDETGIKRRTYLKDMKGLPPSSLWIDLEITGHNRQAKYELLKIIPEDVFDTPKPIKLLMYIIKLARISDDDVILDFFSGSATSAHALMQYNVDENIKAKYIMVQYPEATDEKSEAYKAGYKNICEIGKERIRRAGEKLAPQPPKGGAESKSLNLFGTDDGNSELKTPNLKLDTGFRVLKLDDTNMKDVYYSAGEYSQQMLLDLESNIKEDRTDLDLLYGVLLDWGVSLSLPHITETVGGKKVHFVNETDLVACFEENVNETVVREIAKRKPLRVVFRDSSFGSSPEKINVSEIFKTLSPDTTIKVI